MAADISSGIAARRRQNSRSTALILRRRCNVLHDDQAITIRDDEADDERYVTIGMDAVARVLVVICTWRGSRPRLISARPATPQERQEYETNHETSVQFCGGKTRGGSQDAGGE